VEQSLQSAAYNDARQLLDISLSMHAVPELPERAGNCFLTLK
jgi:hypothetical protein